MKISHHIIRAYEDSRDWYSPDATPDRNGSIDAKYGADYDIVTKEVPRVVWWLYLVARRYTAWFHRRMWE